VNGRYFFAGEVLNQDDGAEYSQSALRPEHIPGAELLTRRHVTFNYQLHHVFIVLEAWRRTVLLVTARKLQVETSGEAYNNSHCDGKSSSRSSFRPLHNRLEDDGERSC